MARAAKVLPKLWRVRRGGKPIGAWHVNVGGHRVNLRTKDAGEAEKRARKAARGVREFDDDAGGESAAASILEGMGAGGGGGADDMGSSPAVETVPAPVAAPPMPPTLPAAATDGPPAAAAAAPSERHEVAPTEGWADALAGAAAPAPANDTSAPTATEVPSELVEQIITAGADLAIEGQLMLQSWLIKKGAKVKTAPVPSDAKGREVGRAMWSAALRELMPKDLPLPVWVAAPLMIAALTLPVQLGPGAEAIKEEDQQKQEEQPAAAAA